MTNPKETMHTAYRVAGEIMRDRLKSESPEALRDLEQIPEADVLVTRGEYDNIESVFELAGTPHTLVHPKTLDTADLRPDQIVFVNCPGQIGPNGLRRLVSFVHSGGFLFTTDWALKHVLEPGFPGIVEYNQRPTRDEVVRIEMLDREDPFLASILGPEDDPQWWLEVSSYPIRILQPDRVKVLVTSKEIASRYGESPVFITFEHGQGRVYHMISHFYLQRTEARTLRHQNTSYEYLTEKGIDSSQFGKYADVGADEVNTAAVEAAVMSRGMVNAVLLEKRRQIEKRKKKA